MNVKNIALALLFTIWLQAVNGQSKFYLLATREKRTVQYTLGKELFVTFLKDSIKIKAKGSLVALTDSTITLEHRKYAQVIDVNSLLSVNKNHRRARSITGIAGGTVATLGVIQLSSSDNSRYPSARTGINTAAGIVLVAAGVYVLYYTPFSLLYETITVKRYSKGWRFSTH